MFQWYDVQVFHRMVAKERRETGNRRTWFPCARIPIPPTLYIEITIAFGFLVVYLFNSLVQWFPDFFGYRCLGSINSSPSLGSINSSPVSPAKPCKSHSSE
jgi:hypothetical protein